MALDETKEAGRSQIVFVTRPRLETIIQTGGCGRKGEGRRAENRGEMRAICKGELTRFGICHE